MNWTDLKDKKDKKLTYPADDLMYCKHPWRFVQQRWDMSQQY